MRATHDPTTPRMWGGCFSEPPSELFTRLNDSFAVDRVLLATEVEASIAWSQALGEVGVLTAQEVSVMESALREIGEMPAPADSLPGGAEDVHAHVEAELAARVGSLAGKLHTGRSRNDQVATDLRLYLKRGAESIRDGILDLAEALARRAAAEHATPMPGYTHLRRAEPVTFGHWCLAYVEMLLRDASRFADAVARGDECPLGSGALSGTPLAVDREGLARALGFARPSANSLDAVSDRDMAAEVLFAGTLLLVHLSRLSEDLILYASPEFGFVELPDAMASGSSRMPHKKNPDLLELVRGHAGRGIGDLTGLLAVLKGIPLAYDKDLQLDKEPVFRQDGTLRLVLPALVHLIDRLELRRDVMLRAAGEDDLVATELADALAARGIPFRRAHEMVGSRVAHARRRGVSLRELGPGDGIEPRDLKALDPTLALGKRMAWGGTAPARVSAAAREAAERIRTLRARSRT